MFRSKNRNNQGLIIPEGELATVVFKGKEVRRVMHDNEWHFSVVDVMEALTGTDQPSRYWNELRKRFRDEEDADELFDNIEKLKMPGADGKERPTDAANVETLFRIIQSVPSKKAEVIKRWLAKTGYERVLENQNPDIAIKRAILDYKNKGRSDEWIEARISNTLTRLDLTHEWGKRGIQGEQYGILTNLIHEGTFQISVQRHQVIKGLKKQNLRDHMTSTELLFSRLGEASTRDITVARDARGYYQNEAAAREGGKIAGNARRALEEQTGNKVVSDSNYLPAKGRARELPDG